MDPVEQWLASAALQIAEAVQKLTKSAPADVRLLLRPGDVDAAIVERVIRIYGIQPANLVYAA